MLSSPEIQAGFISLPTGIVTHYIPLRDPLFECCAFCQAIVFRTDIFYTVCLQTVWKKIIWTTSIPYEDGEVVCVCWGEILCYGLSEQSILVLLESGFSLRCLQMSHHPWSCFACDQQVFLRTTVHHISSTHQWNITICHWCHELKRLLG